ncbi:helix-turn-helix domain-containing protein [Pseudomonas sp. V1]|uniref:helix-turn-helix domain-containing protein n=1 Tax=Pseudomonas arcuscaelestis TaxID=2710591 RepID=UPI00193EF57F|nr:helix-turn-helix domain-containing protein [Pseudomonas arcuscaelestis]MBM3105998.1 helix-turn-helix domain-containing protein [Pseudomonas arcuscaelestis]
MSTNGFTAVLRRMKLITASTTDAELSAALNVSPQTLSSWKGRNSIPYSLCIGLATCHGISLDWLLLGEGPQQRPLGATPTATDESAHDWETRLLTQLRALGPQDQQAIAQAVEDRQRFRQLERQVEDMHKLLHASR